MKTKTLRRSFAGGEITPELFGRFDLGKYDTGLAVCRNFIPLPHGPIIRRTGTMLVNEAKSQSLGDTVRLIPFAFSADQTMILEVGPGYIRFHSKGGTLLSGGVPYEIANPYTSAQIEAIHYAQSADKLTLVTPGAAVAEVRRFGAVDWQFVSLAGMGPSLPVPSAPSVAATPAKDSAGADVTRNARWVSYVCTSVSDDGIDESLPSAAAGASNDLTLSGAFNTVTLSFPAGIHRMNVYKLTGGIYAFIGQATAAGFIDDNIGGDTLRTPPSGVTDPFNTTAHEYPAAVAYFEQRRWFSGTDNEPQTLRGTRTGTESNMAYSVPIRDDDAINIKLASNRQDRVRHLVPFSDLLVFTAGGEWRVAAPGGGPISPTAVSARPQGYSGCSNVSPVVTQNSVLYVQAQGARVREMTFSNDVQGYKTSDMTVLATHLFDGFDAADMAFAKTPYPILWLLRSDGVLLSMTYMPEQQVYAWARHDTDGVFEAIGVVTEDNVDVLYVLVARTINGVVKRFIERMQPVTPVTGALSVDDYYMDCGISIVAMPPVQHLSGLDWLEGKTVAVKVDGAVHKPMVVVEGAIDLDAPASNISIGLAYTSDAVTLPLYADNVPTNAAGVPKNVASVVLRVRRTTGLKVGSSFAGLVRAPVRRVADPYNSPPSFMDGEVKVNVGPTWSGDGQVYVRQEDPSPVELLSMVIEVAIGG